MQVVHARISNGKRLIARIDAFTATWIGHALPAPEQMFSDCDWKPDDAGAYCPRCGDSVGEGETTADGCAHCRQRPVPVDRVVRLGPYADDLRRWILAVKYRPRWTEMGLALGRELGRALRKSQVIDVERCVVVPMPMPWQRRLYRGIDHAHCIACGTARELNSPVVRLLSRSNAPPQTTLAPSQRVRMGSRGFRLRKRIGGWPLEGLQVVLVDDVRTSGTSIRAAARLLRQLKPAKIVAAVAAISDDTARRARAAQRGDGPAVTDASTI